jgi:peptide/nickel transport system permease protein
VASLKSYVVTRALLTIPTILILMTVVFIVMRIMPGDPVTAILGQKAPQEVIDALKHQLGFDQPLYVQYFTYIANVFMGNFQNSMLWGRRPVLTEISEHLPATIELTIFSFLICIAIGLASGVFAAKRAGSKTDTLVRISGITTYALFIPWLGMMMQMVFGVYLHVLPIAGRADAFMEPARVTGLYVLDSIITANGPALVNSLRHLALPALTLGIALSGIFTRLTRSTMIDVNSQDYIRAMRARGLPEGLVTRHAFKNTLVPIITMMGLQFAILLAGAVLTETTFSWPGMGSFLYERISYRDYTTVQGTLVFFAILICLVSLVVDMIYAYIDPRIRY